LTSIDLKSESAAALVPDSLEREHARSNHPDSIPPDARWRIGITVLCHSVVDYFSYLIVPLMPLLVTRLSLSDGEKAWILGTGSIVSGVIQPFVAWISDRLNTRWLGTAGLLLAAIATSAVGLARDFTELFWIQVLSSIGIGAFHPVAAAAVGHLSGARRSLGVSIFFVGGMLGGIAGNTTAAPFARAFGLHSFLYLIVPSLLATFALIAAIHRVRHTHHDAHETHAELPANERRWRWISLWALYVGNVVRFTVNAALVYLAIDWSIRLIASREGADWAHLDPDARKHFGLAASSVNGWLQASMQVGMGITGLLLARLVRPGRERPLLIWMPVLGAIPMFALPWVHAMLERSGPNPMTIPVVFALILIAGVGFGGVFPITIALAQRLIPHRTSLASGLMMGGAWAVGGLGPAMASRMTDAFGWGGAWRGTAIALLAAGVASVIIPGWLIRRVAQK
jgi:FSR family fosmidomycin resistance protein-like MFS transporter